MRWTITITTLGRATLFTTLASIYDARSPDFEPQVHVIVDEAGDVRLAEVTARHFAVSFFGIRPHLKWGDRNAARHLASGSHLAWIDDDDAYIPDGLALMTRIVAVAPAELHSFGVVYPDFRKVLYERCTPSLVVPNSDRYPMWGNEAHASGYFEDRCVQAHGRQPVRHKEITVVVRPHVWKGELPSAPFLVH